VKLALGLYRSIQALFSQRYFYKWFGENNTPREKELLGIYLLALNRMAK
jgi:hypothetical protein